MQVESSTISSWLILEAFKGSVTDFVGQQQGLLQPVHQQFLQQLQPEGLVQIGTKTQCQSLQASQVQSDHQLRVG